MKYIKLFPHLLLIIFMISTQAQAIAKDEFPVRKLYPAVPTIEIEDLMKRKDKVIIVDVRSEYEYKTLRMAGALNIPLASPGFVKDMQKLRRENPGTEIVVYCNGKTCKKSYKATQKCRTYKISGVTAFDAGIFDWARKYPRQAILLGESPVDPSKLIPKIVFKKKLITPEQFEAHMAKRNILVLDVRDRFQREALALFPGIEKRAFLDDKVKLEKYIDQAIRENKKLMVYDAAGKQVRWLMYLIEKKGVKDYVFMKGGANRYFANLRKKYFSTGK